MIIISILTTSAKPVSDLCPELGLLQSVKPAIQVMLSQRTMHFRSKYFQTNPRSLRYMEDKVCDKCADKLISMLTEFAMQFQLNAPT